MNVTNYCNGMHGVRYQGTVSMICDDTLFIINFIRVPSNFFSKSPSQPSPEFFDHEGMRYISWEKEDLSLRWKQYMSH